MERVSFNAPVSAADLRLVMCQHSAQDHDTYQVTYTTPYGERRHVQWLTKVDAHARAAILKRRGYSVTVSRWV